MEIKHSRWFPIFVLLAIIVGPISPREGLYAQAGDPDPYKKRVLEAAEIDMLFSYYGQDGENAAVSGGEGTEKLTDATSSLVVRIPMNPDDVLTVDVGISAYTSASSSNVNPLDGDPNAVIGPFSASSGASRSDQLIHFNPSYSRTSENRRSTWSANAYVSSEYDYFSVGFGGGYIRSFNEANTELSIGSQLYFDSWRPQYPIELRDGFFDSRITGTGTYDPVFTRFDSKGRNSYALSLGVNQILGTRLQAGIFSDLVWQRGLLSTPFQRIYFADRNDFFIGEFQLADDVERLPDNRFKIPLGLRVNYYLDDLIVLRSYYRFYTDSWGITGHTASLEVPLKFSDRFTGYPSYRFHTQTAADYFYPKEAALSSENFYTSDYDLSAFQAHQFGLGLRYTDIFASAKVFTFGLKSVDLRLNSYNRNDGLNAFIITLGTTFQGQ